MGVIARSRRAPRAAVRRRRIGLLVGIGLGCLVGSSVLADLRYETEIAGVEDSALADLLGEVSELKNLQDRLPASEQALRRRAERDLELLTDAAHSLGYWDARFSYRIETGTEPTEVPAKVIVTAEAGPLYHVAEINILGPERRPLVIPRDSMASPLPLLPGEPARTEPVVAAETALLADLGHAGHPFATKVDRRVVIDHEARTMAVTYVLDPGPRMRVGPATISGLSRLDPAYVERRFRWRPGEVYDHNKVEETRRALIDSGLFSAVKIEPVRDPADPDRVAMRIETVERAHRTIGVGAAYNTSEGAAARVFWENRNLFGQAEYLHFSVEAGTQKLGTSGTFRRPDFLAIDQDLVARAEVARENPAAYDSRYARFSVGLERRFRPGLIAGGGISIEKANVDQEANVGPVPASERSQRYALIGLPLFVKLDRSDDLLNPTSGYRLQANFVPYQSFAGSDLTFVSERVAGSAYKRLGSSDRYIVAAFAAVSSIQGASLAELPADKRIYAGGGGSIRAYGYQMAGPLDANDNPIGGRSSLELSVEARIRVTKTIGIVPFFDAGSFYRSPLPQLGERIFYGPGLGLRYYTPFGPVRLDLATPLRRRSADALVQVYISLGQAF
ncbi:MAG TPA: BamA/TamA family outer membrane protein [Stellaceae bacterium]|nr:BamA/TamA family outer membrane protein [Stellaceae bacterium]